MEAKMLRIPVRTSLLLIFLFQTTAGFPCLSHGEKQFNRSDGSCYYLFRTKGYSYTKSKEICESNGTHLVFLENEEEQTWLTQQINGLQIWIGIEKIGDIWYWVSNGNQKLVNESHWNNPPLPDKRYAVLSNHQWMAAQVSNVYPFVCEDVGVASSANQQTSAFPTTSTRQRSAVYHKAFAITGLPSTTEKFESGNHVSCARLCLAKSGSGFTFTADTATCTIYGEGMATINETCIANKTECFKRE